MKSKENNRAALILEILKLKKLPQSAKIILKIKKIQQML
ncbi:MAG: hypothetical protein ACJA1D_000163 [Polaribacter sp.]|jgi:hypothetical protein|tara:strand:+ start:30 stop:146 length:117 start_codon:yes stop_codon:yes gene_type:complete